MHRLLVVVVLLLAGCSAGSDPDAATPQAPPASVVPDGPPPATPPAAPRLIEVTLAGGEVSGVEGRVDVEKGEQLVLRITSDVEEEIHVHGYDLYADLVPGQTAQLAFAADLPGSYEVELHEAGRPLFQLRVA